MSSARPAAKPRFSFDIAHDGDGAAEEGDISHGTTALGRKTNPSTHQQLNPTPQPVSLPTAAPAFKFDIDDDDEDVEFDLGGSTAQRDDRIASNQHASTSASAATAAPVAKLGSAGSAQRPVAPKMLATSHAHSGAHLAASSASASQPAWRSASAGAFEKSLPAVPAVATNQQPGLKRAPSSFKPPRRITPASAGAEAVDREADREGEAGSHVGRAGPRRPLSRLRRAGQAAPHAVAHAAHQAGAHAAPHAVPRAVPYAAHKVQGDNRDDGKSGIALDLLALLN